MPILLTMNIRSLSNPAQVFARDKINSAKTIKSDETADREANGQQTYGDGNPGESLSDEQLQQALERVKEHEGIKKSGLLVDLVVQNNQNFIIISSPDGETVRRFSERDMAGLLESAKTESLRLVDKTA